MKTILIFVTTLDGKVTRWGDPFVKHWSSKEDQIYFEGIWKKSRLIIMGSNTYNAEPIKPEPDHLVVIMTANPSKYKEYAVQGQLEFSNEPPAQLAARFKKEGYKEMLVVGGAHVATSFLKRELIDEILLSIEPRIFASGGSFVVEDQLDVELRLISCERVNEQGTLFTKYKVVKKI